MPYLHSSRAYYCFATLIPGRENNELEAITNGTMVDTLSFLHQQILDGTIPSPELLTSALTFTPDLSNSDEPSPDTDLAKILK